MVGAVSWQDVMHAVTAMVTNSSVPAETLDLAFEQALLASEISQDAILVLHDRDVEASWEKLNESRKAYASSRWQLLEGAGRLERVSHVCIVKEVKESNDLYDQLEVSALAVAHGDEKRLGELIRLTPLAETALEKAAVALSGNASGSNCDNETMAVAEWMQLHEEACALGRLSEDIATEAFLLGQQEGHVEKLSGLLEELEACRRRLMFGSHRPPVPAPASQKKLNYMVSTLEPAVASLREATLGGDAAAVLQRGKELASVAATLQDSSVRGLEKALWKENPRL